MVVLLAPHIVAAKGSSPFWIPEWHVRWKQPFVGVQEPIRVLILSDALTLNTNVVGPGQVCGGCAKVTHGRGIVCSRLVCQVVETTFCLRAPAFSLGLQESALLLVKLSAWKERAVDADNAL